MDVITRFLLVQLTGICVLGHVVHGFEMAYNPLDLKVYNGYRATGWGVYLTEGSLSASTTDYKPLDYIRQQQPGKPACARVVVFMAHGAVLDFLQTDCDTLDHTAGLVSQDSTLRYFDLAVVRQEAAGHFVLIKKTEEKDKCSRKEFVLGECTDKCPRPNVKSKKDSSDTSCNDLIVAPRPSMWLILSSGGVGEYTPVTAEWMTYNPMETLGFVTREYQFKGKCFRLLVVTSEGRAVHPVKLTCGPVYDVTSRDSSLHLADTVYVTVNAEDKKKLKFKVLLNTRNNYCIEKMIALEESAGSFKRSVLSTDSMVKLQDDDCRRLVKGDIEDNSVSSETVSKLKTTPIQSFFKLAQLDPFTASGNLQDYNMARNMGLMVQTYTNIDQTKNKIVTVLVRGVPVRPVIVDDGPAMHIVVRKDAVYYDKDVALTKLYAKNGYQVTQRLDEDHCERSFYTIEEDGTRKETPGIKPKVTKSEDANCKNLIDGTHLKKVEKLSFSDMEQLK